MPVCLLDGLVCEVSRKLPGFLVKNAKCFLVKQKMLNTKLYNASISKYLQYIIVLLLVHVQWSNYYIFYLLMRSGQLPTVGRCTRRRVASVSWVRKPQQSVRHQPHGEECFSAGGAILLKRLPKDLKLSPGPGIELRTFKSQVRRPNHHGSTASFRLVDHKLAMETLKRLTPKVPDANRMCSLCSLLAFFQSIFSSLCSSFCS